MVHNFGNRNRMIFIHASNPTKAPSEARPLQTHLYPPDTLNLDLKPKEIDKIVDRVSEESVAIHGSYLLAKLNKGF